MKDYGLTRTRSRLGYHRPASADGPPLNNTARHPCAKTPRAADSSPPPKLAHPPASRPVHACQGRCQQGFELKPPGTAFWDTSEPVGQNLTIVPPADPPVPRAPATRTTRL